MPEESWYQTDVITCAAPNVRNMEQVNQNELLQLFKKRIEHILQVAIINGRTDIVLGAFGCGAFKNPPFLVARAFKEVLSQYRGYFDKIVFAVLATPYNDENFKVFPKFLPIFRKTLCV